MFHSTGTSFRKYIYSKLLTRDKWIMSGLYVSEIAFLQLIGSCCRVIGVCIDVVFSCRFHGMWTGEYFLPLYSEQSVDFNHCIQVTIGR